MLRNVIILLVSLCIVLLNLYVFKWQKNTSSLTRKVAISLLVIWLLTTFLPNIPVILFPLTPAVKGRVISAETKQPIANCNIKANWQDMSASLAGGHWETYHQFITKTDDKGEFQIPRYVKLLGLYGFFPLMLTRYEGIRIVAYTHGFTFSQYEIYRSEHGRVEKIIEMSKNLNPEYFTDNIWSLGGYLDSHNKPRKMTDEDKAYLLEDFRYHYERMESVIPKSNSKKYKQTLISFASAFDKFGDKEKAIEVFQRIGMEFPESFNFANNEIENLKIEIKKSGRGIK